MNATVTNPEARHLALRIAVRLVVALLVVLAPWPGLGHAFAELASSLGNALTAPWLSSGTTLTLRAEGPADSWDAVLGVGLESGAYGELAWDLRRTPYLPMAVFAALVAAIPFGRPKCRALVLVLGLGVLLILPALRLLLLLSSDTSLRLVELPRGAYSALLVACGALVFPPAMAFVVPALLWVLSMALLDRDALVAGVRSLTGEIGEPEPNVAALAVAPGAHGVLVRRAKKRRSRPSRPRRSKKR